MTLQNTGMICLKFCLATSKFKVLWVFELYFQNKENERAGCDKGGFLFFPFIYGVLKSYLKQLT